MMVRIGNHQVFLTLNENSGKEVKKEEAQSQKTNQQK